MCSSSSHIIKDAGCLGYNHSGFGPEAYFFTLQVNHAHGVFPLQLLLLKSPVFVPLDAGLSPCLFPSTDLPSRLDSSS